MKKIYFLTFSFVFLIAAKGQQKINSKIGQREKEATVYYYSDNRYAIAGDRNALGVQFVYRLPWKKSRKIGVGGLIAADYVYFEDKKYVYASVFADISQWIDKEQKWGLGGQVGHAIYKREYEFNYPNAKGYVKYVGGMYYSFAANYRIIISKKNLIVISPFYVWRYFRHISVGENYSPPSIERLKYVSRSDGFGLRAGIIF